MAASQERKVSFLCCVLTEFVKDGAYFCYCAYVLHILRYSGFLWVMPINTGVFLCGFKLLYAEKAALIVSALGIQKENLG